MEIHREHTELFPTKKLVLVFAAFTAAATLILGTVNIRTVDIGWHLRYGEIIVNEKRLVTVDEFSYATENMPREDRYYPPTHWLFQALLYIWFSIVGFKGLILTKAALAAAAFVLLFLLIVRSGTHPALAFFTSLAAACVSANRFFIRPQMVSYFFFVVYMWILYDFRDRGKNRLFFMPVIMLVWANMHGGCIFGLFLAGAFLGVETLKRLLARNAAGLDGLRLKYLGLAVALTFAASLITPSSYNMYFYLFEHLSIFQRLKVLEFQHAHFALFPGFWIFAWFVSLAVVSGARKLDITTLFITLVFFVVSARTLRLMPYFALTGAYLASVTLQRAVTEYKWFPAIYRNFIRHNMMIINPVLLLAGGLAAFMLPIEINRGDIGLGFKRSIAPEGAVEFLKKHDLPGRICNSNRYGGYLIWFYKEKKVFTDGRMQLYDEIIPRGVPYGIEKFKPTVLLLKYGEFMQSSQENVRQFFKTWTMVYFDDHSYVYVRSTPETKDFLDRYGMKHLRVVDDAVIADSPWTDPPGFEFAALFSGPPQNPALYGAELLRDYGRGLLASPDSVVANQKFLPHLRWMASQYPRTTKKIVRELAAGFAEERPDDLDNKAFLEYWDYILENRIRKLEGRKLLPPKPYPSRGGGTVLENR